jgi:cytoskeletal protein RodZ
MKKERLAESPVERWTRADDYVAAMARKRKARNLRESKSRGDSESPRLLLSTLPFLALFALLAVLAVGIMIAAFPGNQPEQKPNQPPAREQGVAAKGWFQKAEHDFRK